MNKMPIEFEYTGDDDIEEDSEKEEMQEVEVIEVEMNSEEIKELIEKLNELQKSKDKIYFPLSDDLELSISYGS